MDSESEEGRRSESVFFITFYFSRGLWVEGLGMVSAGSFFISFFFSLPI